MKKKLLVISLSTFLAISILGCANTTAEPPGVTTITPQEAKAMMDKDPTLTILDVRTQEEFDSGYIKGATLIPDYEIDATVETLLPDKDATILVYCRSGRRSSASALKLVELGYTHIYDFGGIIDWPYDIETP